jgi:hypothetical protein
MEEQLSRVMQRKASPEDTFEIKYLGFKLKLEIKPLSAKTLIEIGEHLSKCSEIKDEQQTMFHALTENASDLKFIVKCITISVGGGWFIRRAIMNLDLSDIETIWNIVIKNSNAERFFFIMASAKRMNILRKKEE